MNQSAGQDKTGIKNQIFNCISESTGIKIKFIKR